MESSSLAPSAGDAAATTTPQYPAWVLLERIGYSADRDDATSAECKTITGRDVKVTFCLAPPPAVSYFCVHLSKSEDDDDIDFEPLVVFSAKDLVLFRFFFISRTTSTDDSTSLDDNLVQYFIYKAGLGNPSLKHIPSTPAGMRDSSCVSIVPCDDDEENYILADLSVGSDLGHYNLHVYSSKTGKWNTTTLQLLTSPAVKGKDLPSQFHKVIGLEGDEVGWVDLWCGIVTCKVLDNDRVLRLIPLPKPEFNMPLKVEPGLIRDVSYCNGHFKFIEMEHFCRQVIVVNDIIHDSELIHTDIADEEPIFVPDGWKIRICCRCRSDSWDFWVLLHAVHVDDISVDGPRHSILLPQMWDACAQKSTLRNLTTFCPTFGIDGDDVVYLISKVKFDDDNTWIVGVDLGKKIVKLIQPYSASEDGCNLAFLPSTFSYYLNTTPGCFPPTATNHSENTTNNATIHSDSSVPNIRYDPCLRGYVVSITRLSPRKREHQGSRSHTVFQSPTAMVQYQG